jgi:phosphohistidine phosphatase
MILYLVRHGIAINREDPNSPAETERYLTRDGIKKTREAAKGIRALKIAPTLLITSPYVRAVQTAEIFAEALGYSREKIRQSQALRPGSDPADFLKELAHLKATEIMAIGHAPHMDQLIAAAIGARSVFTALKKSGVAALEFESQSTGKATLLWILPPKIIRNVKS